MDKDKDKDFTKYSIHYEIIPLCGIVWQEIVNKCYIYHLRGVSRGWDSGILSSLPPISWK